MAPGTRDQEMEVWPQKKSQQMSHKVKPIGSLGSCPWDKEVEEDSKYVMGGQDNLRDVLWAQTSWPFENYRLFDSETKEKLPGFTWSCLELLGVTWSY